MTVAVIRTLILFGVTIVLFVQSRRAKSGSLRQRSFALAGIALALLTLINLLAVLGIDTSLLTMPVLTMATLLLGISVYTLVRALQAGEMEPQINQVRQVIESERERQRKE